MSNIIKTVTRIRTIRVGSPSLSRYIVKTKAANRTVRLGLGPQGAAGKDGTSVTIVDATEDLTMSPGSIYVADDPDDLLLLTMPTGITRGAQPIEVQSYGLGGFKIVIPNGVTVRLLGGPNACATDGTGYIASDSNYSSARLICVANDTWNAEVTSGMVK